MTEIGGADPAKMVDSASAKLPVEMPRYRWVILALTWSTFSIVYITRLSVGPLAPFLKDAFALSNAQLGSLVSAAVIVYPVAIPFAGWLVDRVGVRRMLITGTLITGVSVVALFFAPSFQVMFVMLLLAGVGSCAMQPSIVKAVLLWFPLRERATAMGMNQTAVNAGGIIGAGLLPTIAITLGWRYGFLFTGLGALAICLCCAVLYRNPPREVPSVEPGDVRQSAPVRPSTGRLMITLFKSRDIWMLGLACLFFAIVEFGAITYLVLYLTESLFFGVVAAGGLLAMTEAAGAFGKPASGFISDRLLGGRRKIVFIFMVGMASVACAALGVGDDGLGWLLYPLLIILGVVGIGWGGLFATMASELGGKEIAGVAYGVTSAVTILGVIAGPPLFGYIVDKTGSFQISWLALALSGAISMVFASLIREREKQS